VNIPSRKESEALLHEAEALNPGPWVAHSRHVAEAARAIAGCHPQMDAEAEEYRFVQTYLEQIEYDCYDRLIQLCDSLALPSGFCLMEKRLVDVVLRYGTNPLTIPKWKAYFAIRDEFESEIGGSIYALLPGVVENTFSGTIQTLKP
jgi:hypothetical protein